MNVLSDLNYLAIINRDTAQSELDRVVRELNDLEPLYERSKKARSEVSENIDRTIDATCAEIYDHTRETLNDEIRRVADQELGVEYSGLLNAFQYAEDIKMAILEQISETVAHCEDDARFKASSGVDAINALGQKHLGEDYGDMKFRSDMLFRRKKDALARQIDTPVEIWDFLDVTSLWERQEKVAGGGMALTVVGVLGGRMVGGVGWLDGAIGAARVVGSNNLRRLIVPGLIASGKSCIKSSLWYQVSILTTSQSALSPPTYCIPSPPRSLVASPGASQLRSLTSTIRTSTAPGSPTRSAKYCAFQLTLCALASNTQSRSSGRSAKRNERPGRRAMWHTSILPT
jgi:hypothetical protein